MQRVIITGITGHLGRELARQLASAGLQVCGLTRQDVSSRALGLEDVRLERIDGRTEQLVGIFEAFQPDTVFHVAGLYRREHAAIDVAPLIEANVLFGVQLLEAMKAARCMRIVIAGSYFQHFDCNEYRPLNLYAGTKQAFEDFVRYYIDACNLAAVRLTLADIYSEHDTRPKLITAIARAWLEDRPMELQDPEARIDPVHVEDTAAAFIHAASLLEAGALPCRELARYSVTYGRDVTASELLTLFERVGGRKLVVRPGRGSNLSRKMRPWRGGVLPGWAARVTIEEGVARILATQRPSAS